MQLDDCFDRYGQMKARALAKPDRRYTVTLEACGRSTLEWVARFCGEWIGAHADIEKARALAADHNEQRSAAL